MNWSIDYEYMRERQKEFLREAEQHRLLRLLPKQPTFSTWLQALLMRLPALVDGIGGKPRRAAKTSACGE